MGNVAGFIERTNYKKITSFDICEMGVGTQYNENPQFQARNLKSYGEFPESVKINETVDFAGGDVDDDIEFDDVGGDSDDSDDSDANDIDNI